MSTDEFLSEAEAALLENLEKLAYAATNNGVRADYPSLPEEQYRFQVGHRRQLLNEAMTPHLLIRILAERDYLRTRLAAADPELTRLREENQELRSEVERLRVSASAFNMLEEWLRDNPWSGTWFSFSPPAFKCEVGLGQSSARGNTLAAAISAAMERKP